MVFVLIIAVVFSYGCNVNEETLVSENPEFSTEAPAASRQPETYTDEKPSPSSAPAKGSEPYETEKPAESSQPEPNEE